MTVLATGDTTRCKSQSLHTGSSHSDGEMRARDQITDILGCSVCDGQQSSVTTEWAVPHGSSLRSNEFPGCHRSLSRDMNTQPRTGEMTPGTRHKQRRGGMCRQETAHAERRLPQSSRLTLPHLLPLLQATPHHLGLDKRSCIWIPGIETLEPKLGMEEATVKEGRHR